jgi:hypothetical protein
VVISKEKFSEAIKGCKNHLNQIAVFAHDIAVPMASDSVPLKVLRVIRAQVW